MEQQYEVEAALMALSFRLKFDLC